MKTALTQGKALGRFKPTASVTFAQGTWPVPHWTEAPTSGKNLSFGAKLIRLAVSWLTPWTNGRDMEISYKL
jgi:hypothetical protein